MPMAKRRQRSGTKARSTRQNSATGCICKIICMLCVACALVAVGYLAGSTALLDLRTLQKARGYTLPFTKGKPTRRQGGVIDIWAGLNATAEETLGGSGAEVQQLAGGEAQLGGKVDAEISQLPQPLQTLARWTNGTVILKAFVGLTPTAVAPPQLLLDFRESQHLEAKGQAGLGLEPWVPLGTDPPGTYPRDHRPVRVYLSWNFNSEDLTAMNYRALESLLHVYPEAMARVITVGPLWAHSYKWANTISLPTFQKYFKRGYDVAVDIIYGRHFRHTREGTVPNGALLPGSKWWSRNGEELLYGNFSDFRVFQNTKDALPDAHTLTYLMLLEVYKTGGIYFDFTTFFVKPLPVNATGFIIGGMAAAGPKLNADGKCALATTRLRTQNSLLLQYPTPKHPVVACVLHMYDKEASALNTCALSPASNGDGGFLCGMRALKLCHERLKIKNDLAEQSVVEWFSCERGKIAQNQAPTPEAAAQLQALMGGPPSRRGNHTVAFWLGPHVGFRPWKDPPAGSFMHEAYRRLRLTKWAYEQVSSSCRVPCSHYDWTNATDARLVARAKYACAPTVFVPGTMKGASTFLFHAITRHPQMIMPLQGAHGFKETGRYSTRIGRGHQKLGLRLQGFPLIEPWENFVTGDGTVVYMMEDALVPDTIHRDNPKAKIVFALREPVMRAWSDYRFTWAGYEAQGIKFSEMAAAGVERITGCFKDILQNQTAKADEEGIRRFYSKAAHPLAGKGIKNLDPGMIVRKGIYYYQVLHWMNVFGRENVMIVEADDLRYRQKETLDSLFKFLGLCPVNISGLDPENVTGKRTIPPEFQMDEKSFNDLKALYEPYNKRLTQLIGRNFGWESAKFKAPDSATVKQR